MELPVLQQMIKRMAKKYGIPDEERQILEEVESARGSFVNLNERLDSIENSGVNILQTTKLGVIASTEVPYIFELDIPSTIDFKRLPLEVLKFVPGEEDVITTLATFDNSDESSFIVDETVSFDGTMHLNTEIVSDMNDEGYVYNYKVEYSNGQIIFTQPLTESDIVKADYVYFSGTDEIPVIGELLTSGDYLTYTCVNSPIKEGSISIYVNDILEQGQKIWSKNIDSSKYKSILAISIVN